MNEHRRVTEIYDSGMVLLDNMSADLEIPKVRILNALALSVYCLPLETRANLIKRGLQIQSLLSIGASISHDGYLELPDDLRQTIENEGRDLNVVFNIR